ncbi:MAG: putative type secretion protein SctL [Chlamydiota bacterium]
MKKLFSLLFGQEVRLSAETKVIYASEVETLIDADTLLATVKKEAAQFKQQAAVEAEHTRELAFHEGFDKGLATWNKQLTHVNYELELIRKRVQEQMMPLVIAAVRKILGDELKLHPDRIVELIMTALKPVTQHKRVVLYVNKDDLAEIEKGRPKIKKMFQHIDHLSIQERDDISPGGCIIETEAGIINAQLENQLRALESAFAAFKERR